MATARVVAVAPGSPAEQAGLRPGDELLTVGGEALRDVIAYQQRADEPLVDLEIRRGGLERALRVEKRPGAPLGVELDSAVFDQVRTCDNHCPFCFIYQLPAGMRPSLSVKDDDYRLSFLYGNFTTLTRFTEADLERVVTEHLSPLYVSIHSTDPALRTRLLRNRRGATSLRWLRALLDHGIEVHGQIVVCPGINDADALDETLLGILDEYPELATAGVVPLGVSDHSDEPELRPHTPAEAEGVVAGVERWQERFRRAVGRRLVFAADEYYLLAGRPFPDVGAYEGLAQLENGIGMAASFRADVDATLAGGPPPRAPETTGFFRWVDGGAQGCDGIPADGYRAPRTDVAMPRRRCGAADRPADGRAVHVLTGEYGAQVLDPLLPALGEAAGVGVRARTVRNAFFGGNIAVTGLLTGADVEAALAEVPAGDRVLLPDVVLSRGRFLDGVRPEDLPRPVEVVATDGRSLTEAVVGRAA